MLLAGAVSTAGHGWVLVAHPHGIGLTVVMAAMALWCAVCTVELWVRPSPHCLRRLCLMSLAMVVTHAVLVAGAPGIGGHTHHTAGATGAAPPTDHASAMLALIAIEFAVALAAGLALRRRHALGPPRTTHASRDPTCHAFQTEGARKRPILSDQRHISRFPSVHAPDRSPT